MRLKLIQNLLSEGATIAKGTVITVADEFGQGLVARSIAIDAVLAEEVEAIEAAARVKLAEAQAHAAEAERHRHEAAAKLAAVAKAKAEEARTKADVPRRGSRVAVAS